MNRDILGTRDRAWERAAMSRYRLALEGQSPSAILDRTPTGLAAFGLGHGDDTPSPNPEVELDAARFVVERYGGWESIRDVLAALVQAIDRIELVPHVFADHLHWRTPITSNVLGTLYEAAEDAESSLRRALRAESVLLEAGYKWSGSDVVSYDGTKGKPKRLFREHVEREFGLLPKRRLGHGNTAPNRRVIREALQYQWNDDPRLEDGNLQKLLAEITKGERRRLPPKRRHTR